MFTMQLSNRVLPSTKKIDVEKFILRHYVPYHGDASFLVGPTKRTTDTWKRCLELQREEVARGGLLDCDQTPATLTAFGPGCVTEDDIVLGLQADAPLKRLIKPRGGWRVVENALRAYGVEPDPEIGEIYTNHVKTHNQGVFDVYTKEMRAARHAHILTGLPDAYGRGRIIGDYRRVALYGVDFLIECKKDDFSHLEDLQLREEVSEQIRALKGLKAMAQGYGMDISGPATSFYEAVQWTYFAYLGSVKEQDGAAMSLGRVDAFFDTYAEDSLTEETMQEIIDDFVIKLRLVRHLRAPEYNALFAGDPTWVTLSLAGCNDKDHMVTKTTYRFLQSLRNLGPAPEPNMTVLWSQKLPQNFKCFCSRMTIASNSIQYENDDLMRRYFGNDYAIACCVSAMSVGKHMQFFGARCNLPKLLLYCLNEGRDEHGEQVAPVWDAVVSGPLEFDDVKERFEVGMDWLAELYVNTMNCIHYSHDKHNYEQLQMALHDTYVHRLLAFGIAGISVVADSMSAIKYAEVVPKRNEENVTESFDIVGSFPKYGNDDPDVDDLAVWVAETFLSKLRKYATYRDSEHTLSLLTITANVVYGKATGATPDGREAGKPFAPGANPMHGRDTSGLLASLNSVAHMPYETCMDGISNTISVVPATLGKAEHAREANLSNLLDGYFFEGGHHVNVNVLHRDTLLDAMENPEEYPQLTIRVSGYAVHFIKLTKEQQLEVIARTFHEMM